MFKANGDKIRELADERARGWSIAGKVRKSTRYGKEGSVRTPVVLFKLLPTTDMQKIKIRHNKNNAILHQMTVMLTDSKSRC